MLLGHSQDLPRTPPGCILGGPWRHSRDTVWPTGALLGPFLRNANLAIFMHSLLHACLATSAWLVSMGMLWDYLGMLTGYLWHLTGTFRDTLRMFPKTLPDIHGTLQGHCRDYDPEIAGIKY